MTENKKGRAGCNLATLKNSNTQNFTGLVARVKGFIVTLALWGVIAYRASGFAHSTGRTGR